MRFSNIEGDRIYHLNADYSTSWLLTSVDATLRTTQGGQRHFQGGQNAPFAPLEKSLIVGIDQESCIFQKNMPTNSLVIIIALKTRHISIGRTLTIIQASEKSIRS